ncbi:MAG TPA: molybdate ABC transporter substrate-binding protein [Spirochaetia bacterium]|nr:molybdate ABC transporter substrate-binding protein [Spirochaetia bacterium]
MKRYVLSLFIILGLTVSVTAQTVFSVAAAANLSAVDAPLREAFAKANPGMELRFTFGASGTLVTQITQGAPYQAFLSADRDFAQKLVDAGLATGPVRTYAVGQLIFLATQPMDLSKGLKVLLDPQVAQFANCNPEIAPYGRAAVEALTAAGLWDQVKAKQILAQSVTQAFQFTVTATNFGFVNRSVLFTKEGKAFDQEGSRWFAVDPSLYRPIEQGYVTLKSAEGSPAAQAFERFLFSPEARKVFAAYGYGAP